MLLLLVAATAYALRDPSPVGYFTSGAAYDRFRAAYQAAMADMPVPDQTLDIRTGYGVVRVYHFKGAGAGAGAGAGTGTGAGAGTGTGGERGDEAEGESRNQAEAGAPPLLLLPGRASASPVWADNMPTLLKLRDVYTVDLLGEPGLSVQQRPITTAEDHAQWLHEVLMALPEPRFHLFGLSIGGWTAMNLALYLPEKVAGVILLDPVLTFADLSVGAVLRSIPVSVRWAPRSWRDDFASWTANDAPVEDVPVADMIEQGLQSYKIKLSAPARPNRDRLAGLAVPALVLMAGASRMHDAAEAAAYAGEVLPNATVKTYPNASHAINGEHPTEIAADVATFIGPG
ncbi:alpha/beta hydrolase [Actinoplanes couchii]|uniref:Alpha/beta hydrolase n=1 Tax=Actinoplanes couchii TaxID=403638 RepID=A0ABQ3XN10_9ACTN|nr:alpha/beta hydrolase [Actinoplanes couchii]